MYAASSTTTTIFMGTPLKFQVDQGTTTLQLVLGNGSLVNVWGQTLQYAFEAQQSSVTLYFTPVAGSAPVSASYVNGQGTTVQSTQVNGNAVLTIQRPPSVGVGFDIQLEQESTSAVGGRPASAVAPSAASASAVPRSAARVVSASASPGALHLDPKAVSRPAAGISIARPPGSSNPQPTGPGARLQTRLVLSTVNPPPDPDARPETAAG